MITATFALLVIGGIFAIILWEMVQHQLLMSAVKDVSASDRERLIGLISSVGTAASTSYFLLPRNEVHDGKFTILLPKQMDARWLSEKSLKVSIDPDSADEIHPTTIQVSADSSQSDFSVVPIPRIKMKNGKAQNRYQPTYWFKKEPELEIICRKYSRNPEAFASYFVDGIGRVNAPFEWLQSPPKMRCPSCRGKMHPVFQIDGGPIGLNSEAVYYVAACNCENEQIQTFMQLS